MYGICTNSPSDQTKRIVSANDTSGQFINTHFDGFVQGVSIHVKFTQGNSLASGTKLAIRDFTARDIIGKYICDPGTIICFTLDENGKWIVNGSSSGGTEYVFKTAYDATNNKAVTEADIANVTLSHKLTFGAQGAYTYDGSTDVNVPVYDGSFI